MIKVQGLARRRPGMTHEDCVRHHREVHSRLGMGQAEHMGKYVLYYFVEARAADGAVIEDLPWDMSALEWFLEDARWENFQKWLESGPDGQAVKTDEANFLARDKCYLCPYDENILVDTGSHDDAVDLVRLLKVKRDVPSDHAVAYHRDIYAPVVARRFGGAIGKYVAHYILEATSLATGRIPRKPVDIIEIYKIDRSALADIDAIVAAFGVAEIATAEDTMFDRSATVTMTAEEARYIP